MGWPGIYSVYYSQVLNVVLLCKSKKEGGSAGASPVAAPMPKSVPH